MQNNEDKDKKIESPYSKEIPKLEPKESVEYCDCPNCEKLFNHLLGSAKKYQMFTRNAMGYTKDEADAAISHFCSAILTTVGFFINHEKGDEMASRVLEALGFPPKPVA